MLESQLSKLCINALKKKGIWAVNVHVSGWTAKGVPDIIACINGKFVAFELKVGSNDLSPAQKIHAKRIVDSGGAHYCPRSISEFDRILEDELNG